MQPRQPSAFSECLRQRGTIIEPEGPHWVLDLNEQAGQVVQEANPPNQDWRLAKNRP